MGLKSEVLRRGLRSCSLQAITLSLDGRGEEASTPGTLGTRGLFASWCGPQTALQPPAPWLMHTEVFMSSRVRGHLLLTFLAVWSFVLGGFGTSVFSSVNRE